MGVGVQTPTFLGRLSGVRYFGRAITFDNIDTTHTPTTLKMIIRPSTDFDIDAFWLVSAAADAGGLLLRKFSICPGTKSFVHAHCQAFFNISSAIW